MEVQKDDMEVEEEFVFDHGRTKPYEETYKIRLVPTCEKRVITFMKVGYKRITALTSST